MLKEIKSVRVREGSLGNNSSLDKKVILSANIKDGKDIKEKDDRVLSGLGSAPITYDYNRRYKDFTDDDYINDYVGIVNKQDNKNWSIVQNPWGDVPSSIRSFGYDSYYLNNGSTISITWTNKSIGTFFGYEYTDTSMSMGGKQWSSGVGGELEIPSKFNLAPSGFSQSEYQSKMDKANGIKKSVKILPPGNNKDVYKYPEGEPFMKITSAKIVPISDDSVELEFNGDKLDIDIINIIINYWKNQVPNYTELSICENHTSPPTDISTDYPSCKPIKYMSPINPPEIDEPPAPESGTQSGTQSVVIDGQFTFNIEKDRFFIPISSGTISVPNDTLGELSIVPKDEDLEGYFVFRDTLDDYEELGLEYTESDYAGEEEVAYVPDPDEIRTDIDQSETKQVSTSTSKSTTLTASVNGFTQISKDIKVDTEYSLTGFRYGIPKITIETWISWKLEQEGGLVNAQSDSASKDPNNICPSTKTKGYTNPKSGKLMKNIHTNKGITYGVWSKRFGKNKYSKFLDMSSEDWWTIMSEKYYLPNFGDKFTSKICGLHVVSMAWGSGSGGAGKLLRIAINLANGNNNLEINTTTIKMKDVIEANKIDESILISALYDTRAQFFLNISQPGVSNNTYRTGWMNGINKWIKRFHSSSQA